MPANGVRMAAYREDWSDLPDMKVSVRQVFGIDSDLEVPAYAEPNEHVPDTDSDYGLRLTGMPQR